MPFNKDFAPILSNQKNQEHLASMKAQTIIHLSGKFNTEYGTHKRICQLAEQFQKYKNTDIGLDFKNVEFIASNQFAALGCIVDTYSKKNPNASVTFFNVKDKIKKVMQMNGMHKHLGLKKIPDQYKTAIPFTIFDVKEIDEFERYILMEVFSRPDLPKMSALARNNILDTILEIFNNVKEHTSSQFVYSCGQYFPKSSFLYLTIVDAGETIPFNVTAFFKSNRQTPPANSLEWAIRAGNTTRLTDTPGGLGLSLLCDFIELNKGKLYIVSEKETFEKVGESERTLYMENAFPGTIVTVAINLSDEYTYRMTSENTSEISF